MFVIRPDQVTQILERDEHGNVTGAKWYNAGNVILETRSTYGRHVLEFTLADAVYPQSYDREIPIDVFIRAADMFIEGTLKISVLYPAGVGSLLDVTA